MSLSLPHGAEAIEELQRMTNVVKRAQLYYDKPYEPLKTGVLPAALMSLDECWKLKGVHHITLPPQRIKELAAMSAVEANTRCESIFSSMQGDTKVDFELEELSILGKDALEDQTVFESAMQAESPMPQKLLMEVSSYLRSCGDFPIGADLTAGDRNLQ